MKRVAFQRSVQAIPISWGKNVIKQFDDAF